MQNYTFNSKLPIDEVYGGSLPSLSAQMNPQQLQLHLELQQQLNKSKQYNEDDYEYNDDDDYDEELDDDDEQNKSKSNNSFSQASLKRPKGELTCVVCGAAANGYNFDAITCESCKAFFRRNAFRPINLFRCSNNNQCEINVMTRKKCKKCRIVKCFNLGMRRDWIMTEMEREEKRRKIEENRKKKGNDNGCSSLDSIQNGESSIQTTIAKPIRRRRRRRRHTLLESKTAEPIRQILDDKKKLNINNYQVESPYNSYYSEPAVNSNLYQTYPNTSSQKSYYYENDDSCHKRNRIEREENIKASVYYTTFSPQSIASNSQPPSNSSSPSLLEQDKNTKFDSSTIDAIRKAYKQAIQLVKAHGQPNGSDNINDTINLTELGVRRIIFYFKLIADFRNLTHELMIKLLKQNMMNIIQIHGINSYNKELNSFKEPDTDDVSFSADSLQSVYGEEVYKKILNITINLHDLCHGDMVYIKLLMLIILFDPQNESLTNEEKIFIKSLQDKYMNLTYASLCQHLGCTTKANLVFKGMMFEVNKINDLARWFEKTVVERSDSEYVRPLMREVFGFPSDHTPPSSIASSTSSSLPSVGSIPSVASSSICYQSPQDKIEVKQEAF